MLDRVERPQDYQSPVLTHLGARIPLYKEVHPWQRFLKRGMDIGISILALTLFGLALPLIALIIKLDSRGPVFYSQIRVGINRRSSRARSGGDASQRDMRKVVAEGKPFRIFKLRSMFVDSESDGVRWAEKGDPRVTRIGTLLRLTRLDEFPQFWNVLKGEMSVVGPRPERPPFITLLSSEVPGYLERLRFKPGITGLAQVESGYDQDLESVHRKVTMDLKYITEFTLWRDFQILFRSFWVVFTGKGAY